VIIYRRKLGIFLLAAALVAVMVGCAPDQGSLMVSSTEGGEVIIPGEGTFAYDTGMVVDLVAVAEEGYYFVNWSGDVDTVASVFAATTTVTTSADYSIMANFVAALEFSLNPDVGVAIRGDIGDRGYLFPSDVQDHNPFH
jgi:hypothetical protein